MKNRSSMSCVAKVFLIFVVLVCFGLIGGVSRTNPAHAVSPPAGGLPACLASLNTCTANLNTSNANLVACTANLNTCTGNLSTCQTDLTTCNSDLAACQASSQTIPGDGYPNPDAWGVSGHGPALSYTDNGDGTFTDNLTKLMWEKKLAADGSDGGNCADPTQANRSAHCVNNTYSWSTTAPNPDGTIFTVLLNTLNNKCSDEATTCTSDTDCTGIGNEKCGFAGHRDWRLPNMRELQSIVDYSKFSPTSSVPGATGTTPFYQSATTFSFNPAGAYGMYFLQGMSQVFGKTGGGFARAVRP